MLKRIDPKEIGQNVFSPDRGAVDAHHRRNGGAVQHHDRFLGRSGGVLGAQGWPPAISVPSGTPGSLWTGRSTLRLRSLGSEYRKALALCGGKSGREVDKVRECGFTVKTAECGAPYFEQAQLVLVCRKRYVQPMDPDRIPEDEGEVVSGTGLPHHVSG